VESLDSCLGPGHGGRPDREDNFVSQIHRFVDRAG